MIFVDFSDHQVFQKNHRIGLGRLCKINFLAARRSPKYKYTVHGKGRAKQTMIGPRVTIDSELTMNDEAQYTVPWLIPMIYPILHPSLFLSPFSF